jgi:hypothetical protein
MRNFFVRRMLQRMGKRYDYDPSYLLYLLDEAPKAFWTFMRATALARYREHAPEEATLTVKLLATMTEDCGPCTQLVVHHAREAKMATDQIEAVLTRNLAAMNPIVALAYRYADAVLNRRPAASDVREAVRGRWGNQGLIDLALSMQGARLYPMIKIALGYAVECQRVQVEGRSIEVRMQIAQ